MKRLRPYIILCPLLMLGCLEIETTSKVNPHGSIHRLIKMKGSAQSISDSNFNLPRLDADLWEIKQDSLRDDEQLYSAQRLFESVEALNKSFELNSKPQQVHIKANLEQNEGFFFTRHYYTETLWAELPGPDISMETFLTAAELEALFLNDSDENSGQLDSVESQRIEDQFDKFIQARIYEDFVGELRQGARQAGVFDSVDSILNANNDSLVVQLSSTNYYDENQVWKNVLHAYLSSSVLDSIEQRNAQGFASFYMRWAFFEEVLLDEYILSVEMPGVIRKTSAVDVRGNRVTWEPESILVFFGGIKLEAESSQVRIWSVVVTGVLLLLTLVVSVMSYVRQRKLLSPI